MTAKPDIHVLRAPGLALQVCVPAAFDDDEIANAANIAHPCGTSGGWHVANPRTGDPRRVPCEHHAFRVHVVMEC